MFHFGLQRILDLRHQHEREMAAQHGEALRQRQAAQEQLDALLAARTTSAEQVSQAGAVRPAGEISNLALVVSWLDGHVTAAHEVVQNAESAVTSTNEALTEAVKDRRLLDRLRDRHQTSYNAEAEQIDRRLMDEIALARHIRGGASTPDEQQAQNDSSKSSPSPAAGSQL